MAASGLRFGRTPAPLARSYLFAPGSSDKLLERVFDAGADAVILDLEDGVAAADKEPARQKVAARLRSRLNPGAGGALEPVPGPAVYVRINDLSGDLWRDDVAAVVVPGLAGLRVPKAESAEDLRRLDGLLAKAEERAGLAVGSIHLSCTVETAAGVFAAPELAASRRVANLCFGTSDFLRDIGGERDPLETASLYARSHLVLVSRAANLAAPIASVYTRLDDPDGLRASTVQSRRLGYFGRSAIHPNQLPVIHEVFTPSREEIASSLRIIRAFEEARATGSAVSTTATGDFVDLPVVLRAQALLDLAKAAGVEIDADADAGAENGERK